MREGFTDNQRRQPPAARLAIANARLHAEVRARVTEVDAPRLVEAANDQRRQLERELRDGAERRLTAVAELLSTGGPSLAELETGLEAVRELRELARGIHPGRLPTRACSRP